MSSCGPFSGALDLGYIDVAVLVKVTFQASQSFQKVVFLAFGPSWTLRLRVAVWWRESHAYFPCYGDLRARKFAGTKLDSQT